MKRIVLAALALVLAGCASPPETADQQVRQQLIQRVEAVKSAALGNDRPGAEAALAELNRDIATAQAQGKLNPDLARSILTAVERVADDVRTIPLPAPPPPVIVTITPEAPPPMPNTDSLKEQEKQLREQRKQWEERMKDMEKHRNGNGQNGDN